MGRTIDGIIVHNSATFPSWFSGRSLLEKITEIRRWHVEERGWQDIGYHYLIDENGSVGIGRDINVIGAHTRGHNRFTIGICLIGGHGSSENDIFGEHFTLEQDSALRQLIKELNQVYGPLKLNGHNEFAAKACPGFKVSQWYEQKKPRTRVESRTVQGGAMAGLGTCGTVGADLAMELQSATNDVQGLIQYAPALKTAFVALTLAGIFLALYRRMGPDWRRGRR